MSDQEDEQQQHQQQHSYGSTTAAILQLLSLAYSGDGAEPMWDDDDGDNDSNHVDEDDDPMVIEHFGPVLAIPTRNDTDTDDEDIVDEDDDDGNWTDESGQFDDNGAYLFDTDDNDDSDDSDDDDELQDIGTSGPVLNAEQLRALRAFRSANRAMGLSLALSHDLAVAPDTTLLGAAEFTAAWGASESMCSSPTSMCSPDPTDLAVGDVCDTVPMSPTHSAFGSSSTRKRRASILSNASMSSSSPSSPPMQVRPLRRLSSSSATSTMSTATAAHRSEGGSRLFGKVHPVRAMRAREVGGHAFVSSEVHVASEQDRFLPNTNGRALLEYEARPYCGQFSDDGKFFYACTQDFNVHLYDASDPLNLREYKTVTTSVGQWTITDATLSPDNQLLAHSSITPYVDIASTDPYLPDEKTTINLSHGPASTAGRRFGIWSLRFSSDGRELVAGTSSNSLVIYDLDRRSVVLSVRGHADDVNAVCFADASTHVLFSGSDDSLIKVWDRRTLRSGDAARPVGVLPGHTEGITYVASRGDGRYCVSNGKDQCAKVWDVRMCMAPDKFDALPIRERDARIDFDYRYMSYPLGKYGPSIHRHTHDASVVTLMGHHQVLSTLIRCHFAPNGAPYIATGSANGSIAIYNLQGEAMRELRAAGAAGRAAGYASYHGWRRSEVVRDVAWHPHGIPLLLSTTWAGEGGVIAAHEYDAGLATATAGEIVAAAE